MPIPEGYEGSFKWHTVNVVGLVMLLLMLVPLPITYIQWKKRNHPIMRFRLPTLLFVVHWGAVPICGILDAIFYLAFPHLPCEIIFWNLWIAVQLYAYPYVLRSWKLLWLFRTTKQRVFQHESNISQSNAPPTAMGAWLVRHRWMAEDRFLLKLWGFGFIFNLFPALILQIVSAKQIHDYSPNVGEWCVELDAQFYFTIFYGVVYVGAVAVLSFFLAQADDAYFIKSEYRACSVIWLLVMVIWIVWLETEALYSRFPTFFWFALGFVACFFINGYWLTYKLLTEKDERPKLMPPNPGMKHTPPPLQKEDSASSLSSMSYVGNLRDLLSAQHFRQEFYEFLVLEFCVENLMFWEEVKRWQDGGCNLQGATKIYKRFVAAGAQDQVNLTFQNVEECRQLLDSCSAENPPPSTLFDSCVEEVVTIMDTDSLHRFRTFMRGKKAAARLAATQVPRRTLAPSPLSSSSSFPPSSTSFSAFSSPPPSSLQSPGSDRMDKKLIEMDTLRKEDEKERKQEEAEEDREERGVVVTISEEEIGRGEEKEGRE